MLASLLLLTTSVTTPASTMAGYFVAILIGYITGSSQSICLFCAGSGLENKSYE